MPQKTLNLLAALAGLTAVYVLTNEIAKRRLPPDRP